jgi:hypothetical protein
MKLLFHQLATLDLSIDAARYLLTLGTHKTGVNPRSYHRRISQRVLELNLRSVQMSAEQSFQTLKNFFETRQAARQAMSSLGEGVEIGILIADSVECALFQRAGQPIVEQRPAKNPDVIFSIKPESIEILATQTKDEIGDIGVAILKEVITGNVKIKIPGRIMHILTRGYVDIIRKGGAPVMAFLARRGLTGVPKIISTIKNMKR